MIRRGIHAVILAALFAFSVPLHASSASLVRELATMRASKLGVDAANNLWGWNAATHIVTRYSPTGDRVQSESLPEAGSVDADATRGILLLSHGRDIRLMKWDGTEVRTLRIPDEAYDIAWLDGDQVAVSPKWAAHRVEIWDLTAAQRVAVVGAAPPVARASTGITIPRTTLLRYDRRQKELITVEALRGDVVVFDKAGAVSRKASVPPADHETMERWIAQKDAELKAAHRASTATFASYPTFTITPDGSAWIGQAVAGGVVTAAEVKRDGTVRRTTMRFGDCANIRLQAWEGFFIAFRDPAITPPGCTSTT